MTPAHRSVPIGAGELRVATCGTGRPEVVLLHDGLGSIGQWREVPAMLHDATGRTVVATDRAGHGASTPVPTGPWPADWLHREAAVLPGLLDAIGADRPLLVGHSDGGSIALLAAVDGVACRGVVTLAAHTFVERVCVDSIVGMRSAPDRIVTGLARYHEHPDAVFEAWSGVWTSAAFRDWDIRPQLGSIDVPVLVVQGDGDEYATDAQALDTAAAIGADAECVLLPGGGHLLHHQAPERVVELVRDHLDRCR